MTNASCESHCSLPEAELKARIAELRRDLIPHVRGTRALEGDAGVALAFEPSQEREEQLSDLVAFERQCCSGIGWEVAHPDGGLELHVTGVPADAPLLQSFGLAAPEAGGSGVGGAARAGGLGMLGAFGLFCGLPIALTALGGGAIAAWMQPLDHPAAIVIGGVAIGGLLWWWRLRSQAAC